MAGRPVHLAAGLDGAGWHPAAWRDPSSRPAELFDADYWIDIVRIAEYGLLDYVTIEDATSIQTADPGVSDRRVDQVRGRLDAVLLASRIAPATTRIGIVPTTVVTHTEPFHTSKAIATLDYVSLGRAGWRPRISASARDAALLGLRPALFTGESRAAAADLLEEAADAVEVVRELWDSWEDDAVIRDAATGRFLDRDKLHYVDFEGRHFSIRGPSITPRPPQGQPPVIALAHAGPVYEFAARSADVVHTTPHENDDVPEILAQVRSAETSVGRAGAPLLVFGDLVVFLADTEDAAHARKDQLDELAGGPLQSDADIFVGTPSQLADRIETWHELGLDGVHLRPGVLTVDLPAIAAVLAPELRRRGLFQPREEVRTLRGHLGFPRPANRYADVA